MRSKNVPRAVARLLDELMRTEVSKDSVWCPIAANSWEKILGIAQEYNAQQQAKPNFESGERSSSRCYAEIASSDCEMDGQTTRWNGPIDNTTLCEPHGTTMSRDLLPGSYNLVPECIFEELVALFGIVPASAKSCPSFRCRTRLNPDEKYEIEVTLTPIFYHLGYGTKRKEGHFSRFDNLLQIYLQIMMQSIGSHAETPFSSLNPAPSPDRLKIYQMVDSNNPWIELPKEEPLCVIGLAPRSTICFDIDESLERMLRSKSERAAGSKSAAHHNRRGPLNSLLDERPLLLNSPSKENEPKMTVRGLCGLVNLGNTCFMNSSIQCLSNVPDLREYFESDTYKDDMEAGSRMPASTANVFRPNLRGAVANAFSNLLKEMWKPGATCCDPSALKSAITRISNKFSGYSQQDSQELMGVLLDALHEDVKKPWHDADKRNELEMVSSRLGKQQPASLIRQRLEQMSQDITCSDEEISRLALCLHRCQGESYVMQLLQGMVKSTVQCLNCYQYSRTFDPFIFLCLPISEEVHYNGFSLAKRSNFKTSTSIQRRLASCNNAEAVLCPLITINGAIRVSVVFITRTMNSDNTEVHQQEQMPYGSEPKVSLLLRAAEECCVFVDTGGIHPVPRLHMVYLERGREAFNVVRLDEPLDPMLRQRSASEATNCDKNLKGSKLTEYVLRPGYFLCQCPPTTFADKEPVLVTIALDRYPLFPFFVSHVALRRSVESPKKGRSTGVTTSISLLANQTLKNIGFDVQLIQTSIEPASRGDHDEVAFGAYVVKCSLQDSWRERPDKNEVSKERVQASGDKKMLRKRFKQVLYDRLENAKLPHVSDPNHGVTLNQCFSLFTETELLDEEDMWFCSECKRKSISTKKMDIFELPPYLLIQLKRFRQIFYGRQKIDTLVEFPVDQLDLSNFLPKTARKKPCTYELVAISNHYGSLHGGHYTALARNCIDNNWYGFDDRRVSKIEDHDQLVSSKAYILVYKQSGFAL